MRENVAGIGQEMNGIRAGVISFTVLALCYLYITGLSSLPRVWAFTVLFAVCFTLMMKSVVDLMVWVFGLATRWLGIGLGRAVKLFCRTVLG